MKRVCFIFMIVVFLLFMAPALTVYAAQGIDGLQAYTQALNAIVQVVNAGIQGITELFKAVI